MGRTPWFRFLQRSFAAARLAERNGWPADEAVERLRSAARRSRREFVRDTLVVAGGLTLGCRAQPKPATAAGPDVVVLGAGIAGLACGYRLMEAGVPVRILEVQKRAGGRMWSLRDRFPEGQVCELGGELIDTNHARIHALCAELGIELDDFGRDDPALATDVWYFDGRRIADAEVVEAFRPIAARIDAAWEALSGDEVSYRNPNGGEAVDRMSIAEWLDGAGAHGWFRKLLDVGYTTEYGLEIDRQSAWNLLMLIDSEPDPFRIFGSSDERFHVRGGNDRVPTELAVRLGDRVELETRVEAIGRLADGRYRIAVERAGTAAEIVADRVVVTLPFTLLRETELDLELPEVKRWAIDELGYGTNAKLMVGFSERLWRTEGGSNGSVLSDLPFQLCWESTRLQPGRGGILVGYTGGRRGLEAGEGTPGEQAERFARELDRIFPGVAALRTDQVRFHWPSFPWVRGSYACYLPGQWTRFGGAEGERVGNLHFAGEHTSVDFQGFMEGGCESGERAAGEILADLGLAAGRAA